MSSKENDDLREKQVESLMEIIYEIYWKIANTAYQLIPIDHIKEELVVKEIVFDDSLFNDALKKLNEVYNANKCECIHIGD